MRQVTEINSFADVADALREARLWLHTIREGVPPTFNRTTQLSDYLAELELAVLTLDRASNPDEEVS